MADAKENLRRLLTGPRRDADNEPLRSVLAGRSLRRPAALLLTVAVLALLPVLSLPAAAAPASQQSYNYTKSSGISVEQAAAMVRRETGGRVLSANPTKSNGQRGYNVRVLVDGKRIKQYYVDDQGRMTQK